MRFIDLFAGIGGFRLGLEKANQIRQSKSWWQGQGGRNLQFGRIESSTHIRRGQPQSQKRCGIQQWNDFRCVWTNEWDKYARTIYEKHWGKCVDPRDIRTVDPSEIPDFNLLCGGFPCQSFSIAGKREGFSDTRGTLFFDICRILSVKRPGYCLLENVKGLLSHDEGKTFQVILESLAELGYDCQWQVLNSKHFGVPQNRERVFIIGHLREKPRLQVFPVIQTDELTDKESRKIGVGSLSDKQGRMRNRELIYEFGIQSTKKWLEDGKDLSRNFPQGQRVYNPEGLSVQINSQGGGWGAKTGLYKVGNIVGMTEARTEDSKTIRKQSRKAGRDWSPRRGKNLVERTDSLIGTVGATQTVEQFVKDLDFEEEDLAIRRLTPLECERLQGFPDRWTEGISDTQRYKCLGNAVTVNVIEFLGHRLKQEVLNLKG